MNRLSIFSLRAIIAIAVLALVSLMSHGSAFAQDNQFDVKVMTPAEGTAGEFGLNYTIHFDGVALDGASASQDMSLSSEGRTTYDLPAGATGISTVTVNGVDYKPGPDNFIAIPWAGGCWRFCFRWVWGQYWPWWPRYYIFWYWDPCC
ncbi:MAG: hypothetical protein JWQ98_2559 [Chlorobi bacterium]|nr:hypothetical protein [Chlorobiota bacterium]